MNHNIKPGVATGKEVQEIFNLAKAKKFALPAVNVTGSNTINTVLETAKELNAPVIIQFSNGGAHFNAGKGLSNENQKAAIAGAVAGAVAEEVAPTVTFRMPDAPGLFAIPVEGCILVMTMFSTSKADAVVASFLYILVTFTACAPMWQLGCDVYHGRHGALHCGLVVVTTLACVAEIFCLAWALNGFSRTEFH